MYLYHQFNAINALKLTKSKILLKFCKNKKNNLKLFSNYKIMKNKMIRYKMKQ